jgi:hypothetical protein
MRLLADSAPAPKYGLYCTLGKIVSNHSSEDRPLENWSSLETGLLGLVIRKLVVRARIGPFGNGRSLMNTEGFFYRIIGQFVFTTYII